MDDLRRYDPPEPPDPPDPKDPRRGALLRLIIVLLLVLGGLLLVRELTNMSRLQDCVMSGRTNCAPIDSRAN
ncbi:MAG TPA: hypothetical protein VHX52_08445 [Steroidobacteraceae bacterium]|jgi:hypothetical protein|nr:hypothetical protein [Steroidobacteraceae bacterium]